MQKKTVKYALLSLLLVFLGSVTVYALNSPANAPEQPRIVEQEPEQPTVEELLRLVNEERAKVGVKPLTLNDGVMKSAQLKADDMHKRNYFEHEVKGTDDVLTPEMSRYAYGSNNCVYVSENLIDNIPPDQSSRAVIQAWKNSKPHYEAMTDARYESNGFGIAGTKIVQHLCDEG